MLFFWLDDYIEICRLIGHKLCYKHLQGFEIIIKEYMQEKEAKAIKMYNIINAKKY